MCSSLKFNLPDLYEFPANKYEFFDILDGANINYVGNTGDGDAYVNKNNFY